MIELLLAAERMLDAGTLDQAERLFEQVAEADPRNAIAVVGLARVALARGDEAGAIGLARRALEIDPDNAAARRLADRIDANTTTAGAASGTNGPGAEVVDDAVPGLEPTHAGARRSWLDRFLAFLRRH